MRAKHAGEVAAGAGRKSRRDFLKLSAGLAAMGVVGCQTTPHKSSGGAASLPPSDTLRIAAVGIGGMGQHYIEGCRREEFVALCDLDHRLAGPIFEKYRSARRYQDFREMFDKEAKNIDAVIIATPDHTHAIILAAALQLGKHIYCAKPVAHTIGEVRKIRQAVLNAPKVVTSTSVQSAGSDPAVSTAELLNTGIIGPIRELHIWCNHPSYPCGLLRPTEQQTPPEGMDWDLWIGPAPYRAYNSAYHPWKWRPWWDFGSGTVGDMFCHRIHIYFQELQLGAPATIYGMGSTQTDADNRRFSTPECQSAANMITWEYPARGKLPPMRVCWYDGGMKPLRPVELDHRIGMPHNGMLFVGEKGKLLAGSNGGRFPGGRLSGGLLLPEEKFRDFPEPAKELPRVEDHYVAWTQACKMAGRTACPLELGCEMTEVAQLGALALRTGRVLEWDSKARRITNSATADALVDPPYRSGWSLGL